MIHKDDFIQEKKNAVKVWKSIEMHERERERESNRKRSNLRTIDPI